ncbi:MAG: preprotein translocase subunit SecG [Methanobrevibacter sp.]|nr:preprotein translocase subunit SecG [Methanobrevibacter sp.]
MSVLEIIGGVFLIAAGLAIIFFVSLQTEKSDGLSGVIMGNDSTVFKGKARSNEEKLATVTKYCAIVFFVLGLLLNVFVLLAK